MTWKSSIYNLRKHSLLLVFCKGINRQNIGKLWSENEDLDDLNLIFYNETEIQNQTLCVSINIHDGAIGVRNH